MVPVNKWACLWTLPRNKVSKIGYSYQLRWTHIPYGSESKGLVVLLGLSHWICWSVCDSKPQDWKKPSTDSQRNSELVHVIMVE